MNFCYSCGTKQTIVNANFCHHCGTNLEWNRLKEIKNEEEIKDKKETHYIVDYIQQNPDKINEFISMITEEPLFKDINEIKDLASEFLGISKEIKEDFIKKLEIEIVEMTKNMKLLVEKGDDKLFYAFARNKSNLTYILWALRNDDMERNLAERFGGFRNKYTLYPIETEIQVKEKGYSNKTFWDLADLFLSLTSPVGTMKYIIKKATEK